jgi:D-inositol-3-phosphate glycosyltransferase
MISVHSCPLAVLGGKETGGMNVYIRELSRELAKKGLCIDIFTRSQNPSIPKIVNFQKNIRIIYLKAGPHAPYNKNKVWFHLPEFLHAIQQFSYARKSRYDLIHSHYWLSGWTGAKLSAIHKIPHLHMFHTLGYLKNKATKSLRIYDPPTRLKIEAQLLNIIDHIVVASQKEKDTIHLTYGAPSEKISVIPCGVDTELFRPLNYSQSKVHLGLPNKKFILFVGRIDPVKGIDTLLKAMNIVRTELDSIHAPHLLVIGGDENSSDRIEAAEMRKLKRLTAALELKNAVTFLGAQKQDRLPFFYSVAEMCVLPSRYESFGMVALEAMACGTPVIASKAGGLISVIQDKSTGFLVPEDNEILLAEKMFALLKDPTLKDTMGNRARLKAQEFRWKEIAHQMIALYHCLVEKKNKGVNALRRSPEICGNTTAAVLSP